MHDFNNDTPRTSLLGNEVLFGADTATSQPISIDASRLIPNSAKKSDFCGAFPSIMASPPTMSLGLNGGTTQIAGSILVTPFEPGAFTYCGLPPIRGTVYPDYLGVKVTGIYAITTPSPYAADFIFDTADATGRLEIYMKGTSAAVRVAIMNKSGAWEYASTGPSFAPPSNGGLYLGLITLGAPGQYQIRFEFDNNVDFFGVRIGPTDCIRATSKGKRSYVVVGDSISEPTVSDSGARCNWDGWPQQLSYLTGFNFINAGSGGTGYLKTNGARPKFSDRIAESLPYAIDGIILAGGINDTLSTGAQIYPEVIACIEAAKAANPNTEIIVLSPFWPMSLLTSSTTNLLDLRDSIRFAAQAAGATFLDLLSLPVPSSIGGLDTTLNANVAQSGTTLSVPAVASEKGNWCVQIGSGAQEEVRLVNSVSGTGPYTLTLANGTTWAHSAGEIVRVHGNQYISGSGNQGIPTGSGTADRYTGSDTTHPTILGHRNIAQTVAALWQQAVP